MPSSPGGLALFEPLRRKKPRVGLLGAARIAPKALVAVADGLVELTAVAARTEERAAAFAREHGFSDYSGTYQALLERSDIDVVYVALPAGLHSVWVEEALRAGKHVLCEKPFGLCAAEARRSVELARDQRRLLMEAHHWRYHPLVSALELELPTIGPLRDIEMCFSGPIAAGDIRLNPALGAGVLLDFGCYLIQWQKLLTGDPKPQVLEAKAVLGSPGVEVAVDLELKSCAGAHIKMALDMRPHTTFRACLSVEGEAGRLHYENPLAIDGSFLRISRGGAEQRIPGAGPSTYRGQLEQLVSSLYSGAAPPTSGADLVETQEMLDALVLACGLPARDELARQAQAAVT